MTKKLSITTPFSLVALIVFLCICLFTKSAFITVALGCMFVITFYIEKEKGEKDDRINIFQKQRHNIIELMCDFVLIIDRHNQVVELHVPKEINFPPDINVGDRLSFPLPSPLPIDFFEIIERARLSKEIFQHDYTRDERFYELKIISEPSGISNCIIKEITHIKITEKSLTNLNSELEEMLSIKRKELKIKQEKFKTMFDKSSDAYFLLDDRFRISIYNEKVEQFFGEVNEVLFFHWLDKVSPEEQPKGGSSIELFQAMKESCDGQGELRFEWMFIQKNGEDFPTEISLTLLPVANQNLYFIIIRNVISQKKIEMELRKNLEREKELNEMRSKFISMASHEFKTPLATVTTNLELMELTLEKKGFNLEELNLTKFVDRMRNESRRLNILMEEVLQLGKIEAGKTPFSPIKIEVEKFIREYLDEYIDRTALTREIRIDIKTELKEFYLDVELMEHVLDNLLSNAIKYSDQLITINVQVDDTAFVFEIIDTGIGIPLTEFSQLFDSFFRASNTNHIQGTGLGLVIAKEFVEMHGGVIVCESEENVGSTFRVAIPTVK
ncbi:PAS domain-containing sensor histidine kinase [Flammeovirga sp. SubArs3]|uniref:sensor histidine kinase n=1 Tax=Flammeovirga sp. SubArs3 TaxID=2995316 RepID=UPI00248CCAAA|nr:PAS domain-containing sensor histidine kinase [Flammeovirga sp. SubArs3]